ncbi:hypothetical protein PAXINDRAFT_86066, partial [Paxillus involutus ATCC 200175]
MQDNSPFACDLNFVYVCWNILQKRELNRALSFQVPVQERVELGKILYEVAPALTELVRMWESDLWSKPRMDLQRRALSTLNRLQIISKHVRGSSGYKQFPYNEIRGLIRKFGTPALFITINPSDVCNLLVGLIESI